MNTALFQYISCYCLSKEDKPEVDVEADFNTSHVTVYQGNTVKEGENKKFQYISCYCLSVTVKRKHRKMLNFNTSHVTVYR